MSDLRYWKRSEFGAISSAVVIEEIEVAAKKGAMLGAFHLGQDTINITIMKGGDGRGPAFFEDGKEA